MNNGEKYYGEIWLPDKEDNKSFCILEVLDNQVTLTTNLHIEENEYKIDKIYGEFNGLGVVTFINNKTKRSRTNYIIERVYEPEYSFVSKDIISTEKLKFKKYEIKNSVLNHWIRQFQLFFPDEKELIPNNEGISEIFEIDARKLKIGISKSLSCKSDETKTEIINSGYVTFEFENEISILEAIETYNTFQKFLLFNFGKSTQFESFKFKCLSCDDDVILYYKDRLNNVKSSNYLHYDFFEIREYLKKILTTWYTNQDLEFCTNFVLENLLSQKISHSRRFVNSIFSFEAYYKRFHSKDNSKARNKLNLSLNKHRKLVKELTNISEEYFESFVSKIIRSRDYYVHGNLNQKDIFSEFELLYISFLLDYIVGIQILHQLGFDEKLTKKAKLRAKSTFIDMQRVNEMLNQNVFKQNGTKKS